MRITKAATFQAMFWRAINETIIGINYVHMGSIYYGAEKTTVTGTKVTHHSPGTPKHTWQLLGQFWSIHNGLFLHSPLLAQPEHLLCLSTHASEMQYALQSHISHHLYLRPKLIHEQMHEGVINLGAYPTVISQSWVIWYSGEGRWWVEWSEGLCACLNLFDPPWHSMALNSLAQKRMNSKWKVLIMVCS